MEYLAAVGAGFAVAAAAVVLKLFFDLLAFEHRRTVRQPERSHPQHHRWLTAKRRPLEARTREPLRR